MKTFRYIPFLHLMCLLPILIGCRATGGASGASDGTLATLSTKERAMVQQKQIEIGSTAEVVRLAWGKPSHVLSSPADGGGAEAWHYDRFKTVPRPERLVTRMGTSGRRGWAQATMFDRVPLPTQVVTLRAGRVIRIHEVPPVDSRSR